MQPNRFPGCRMSSPHVTKPNDPLATLRINRAPTGRRRSGWFGKLVLLCLFVGLAAGGAWAWDKYGEELTRPEVRTVVAQLQAAVAADSVLSAQGYLKSEKQASIGAKVPGRVLKVYVREGQSVAPADVLAELEHADIDQTLKAMQASLEAKDASLGAMRQMEEKARADLVEVETTLEQDEREYSRAERLRKTGSVTETEFERAESKRKASRSRRDSVKAALAVSKSRQIEADAQLRESQARFHEAEQQRENLFVRAPFAGIVISKEAEQGESILPGGMGAASGRGSVVTLADLLHLEVEADVKEDYVSRVKKGQPVNITVDAVPDRRFSGRVRTIIPMGDRAKGTVKVKVLLDEAEVAEVNDPQSETFTLFPEMAATVYFLGAGKTVPSGAVPPRVYVPVAAVQTSAGGSYVWQIVNDRLKIVKIEAGDVQDGRMEVRSGLRGGERLVIDPPQNVTEGLLVRFMP